jgi:hypothetical protein
MIVKLPRRGGLLDDYLTLGDNGRVMRSLGTTSESPTIRPEPPNVTSAHRPLHGQVDPAEASGRRKRSLISSERFANDTPPNPLPSLQKLFMQIVYAADVTFERQKAGTMSMERNQRGRVGGWDENSGSNDSDHFGDLVPGVSGGVRAAWFILHAKFSNTAKPTLRGSKRC